MVQAAVMAASPEVMEEAGMVGMREAAAMGVEWEEELEEVAMAAAWVELEAEACTVASLRQTEAHALSRRCLV